MKTVQFLLNCIDPSDSEQAKQYIIGIILKLRDIQNLLS